MGIIKDFSASALSAGFVTVLVGYTSSAVIIFQAANALGATPAEVASWMWALGLGMGVPGILLSLRYKVPIALAWSTSGAAMLSTGAGGIPMPEAIGAFLVSGALITICGFSGWFERAMNKIPMAIAAGMLSGVLLRFGMDAFSSMKAQFMMTASMFFVYLIARRLLPRYAVILALGLGIGIAYVQDGLRMSGVHFDLAVPVFGVPEFSLRAIIGVALPLFVVTMTSQNVPAVAVLQASGFAVPISPLIGWTGVATVILAPFGGFALNLATITAAICTGREAHEDPARRYVAAVAAGGFYMLTGLFGATIGALFAAFPKELVLAIAGFALLGTIGNGLASALNREGEREPAVITFLVTASGVSLFGIGSAFWGMVAGVLALFVLQASTAKFKRDPVDAGPARAFLPSVPIEASRVASHEGAAMFGVAASAVTPRMQGTLPQCETWLGVIGGMGPLATADFLAQLVRAAEELGVARDQDHVPVLVYGDCTVPDRTAAFFGQGETPLPKLQSAVQYLSRQGVGAIAIPCNSAHLWIEELRAASAVPVIGMLGSAVHYLRTMHPGCSTVGVLATPAIQSSGLYADPLNSMGLRVVEPTSSELAALVAPGITEVKSGQLDPARKKLLTAADALLDRGAQVVLLACTEIPIALRGDMQTRALLDCTYALAWACVDHLSTQRMASMSRSTDDCGKFLHDRAASIED
jgi:benzoate membrane transport protein